MARKKGKGRRKTKRVPYNIPDQEDMDLLAADIAKFEKKLDGEGRLTDKAAVTMLRDTIRKVWMRSPSKLAFLLRSRVANTNPDVRSLWLHECNHCKELHKAADIQVDHIKGNHSLKVVGDFVDYYENILNVVHKGLQILCKDCHEVKTYAEKNNISLEAAAKQKVVIKFLKRKAPDQKKYLMDRGFSADDVKNVKGREKCFKQTVKEEDSGG